MMPHRRQRVMEVEAACLMILRLLLLHPRLHHPLWRRRERVMFVRSFLSMFGEKFACMRQARQGKAVRRGGGGRFLVERDTCSQSDCSHSTTTTTTTKNRKKKEGGVTWADKQVRTHQFRSLLEGFGWLVSRNVCTHSFFVTLACVQLHDVAAVTNAAYSAPG